MRSRRTSIGRLIGRLAGGALALLAGLALLVPEAESGELRGAAAIRPVRPVAGRFTPVRPPSGSRKMNHGNQAVRVVPNYNRFKLQYGPTDIMKEPRHVDDGRQDWRPYRIDGRLGASSLWTRTMAGTSEWRLVRRVPLPGSYGLTTGWKKVVTGVPASITNVLDRTRESRRTLTGLKAVHRLGRDSDREIREAEELTEDLLRPETEEEARERAGLEKSGKSEKSGKTRKSEKSGKSGKTGKTGALDGTGRTSETCGQLRFQPAVPPQGGVHIARAPQRGARKLFNRLDSAVQPAQRALAAVAARCASLPPALCAPCVPRRLLPSENTEEPPSLA